MINNVVLIGRLVRDIELKNTQSGKAFAKCTLAVDRSLSKEKKEELVNKGLPTADFINITMWGNNATNASQYVGKGSLIAVEGSIQTGSYTDQFGDKVYTTDVLVNKVRFLSFKDNNNTNSQASNRSAENGSDFYDTGQDYMYADSYNDTVPF